MAWTPDTVAALVGSRGDTSARTAQLQQLLAGIRAEGNASLAALVEKLADGARDSSWRLPLGESGLLEHVLSVVPVKEEPEHALNKQALRLVGNACADCDENRARVVESCALPKFVMDIMKNPEADALLPFAIAAALNVCVDCQPAQLQASEAGLSKVLVDIISSNRLSSCQPSLSHIMTIFELLCNQDTEPKVANPNTPVLLLGLATGDSYDADLDTFIEICTPALAYLTFQDLQPVLLEGGGIELLQRAFHQLYTRFDTSDADPDTARQLKQVGDAFLTVFADISALPGFPTSCPLDSKVVQTLIEWLASSPPLFHLQTAACLTLGNLSRSDESSTALLEQSQGPLLNILSQAAPPTTAQPAAPGPPATPLQLIHAALSFLKNLAIPEVNKPHLGAALLDPTNPLLPRLWTSTRTQPQLQFAAVSLTRLLLVNCPTNVRLLCTPLPDGGTDQPQTPASNLALLTSTAASADEDPIKIEAARAATLVCRALHSSSPTATTEILDPFWVWTSSPTTTSHAEKEKEKEDDQQQEQPALTAFYTTHATPSLTPSLARLLTQPRFPTLRSDAIFVLALMSRSPAGARLALRVLQSSSSSLSSGSHGGSGNAAGTGAGAEAGWQVLAKAIAGSESDELAGVFTRQVVEVEDQEGEEGVNDAEKKGKVEGEDGEGGVTVEKLSLEPQPLDAQGQKQQPARAAQMDRENGMVLLAELLRQFPDELASLRRPLEAALNKGGELVVQDREQGQK